MEHVMQVTARQDHETFRWGRPKPESCSLLKIGQKYETTSIEVHSWHTVVHLKEFPGVAFNSSWFEEHDQILENGMKSKAHHWYARW